MLLFGADLSVFASYPPFFSEKAREKKKNITSITLLVKNIFISQIYLHNELAEIIMKKSTLSCKRNLSHGQKDSNLTTSVKL